MKRLFLFLLLLSPSHALSIKASENPARVNLKPVLEFPGRVNRSKREGFFCGHSLDFSSLSRSPYADEISKSCSIRFTEDQIVVNNEYAIGRDAIVHHWWSEVDGVNHQLLTYLFVRHLENDELITSIFAINHKTWQAVFWNQFNLWLSGG